jgi:UDP-glucuronate 4-epimerase
MSLPEQSVMKFLVTGAAGFIGAYVSHSLLNRGAQVVGIDCLNDYYDPSLKTQRLAFLKDREGFTAHTLDISDAPAMAALVRDGGFDTVIHLAAQAGVRYSLKEPFAYAQSNLVGHLSVLEAVRHAPSRPFLIYASSSSVYGNSAVAPFSETERADAPESLYAATKRSCELMSSSYTQLYDLAQVGLRFFTVYGPWGRPDMAYWGFAQRILAGEPIDVFNNGDLQRDFTWIDDIVDGIVRIAERGAAPLHGQQHRIYNIGNNRPERLMDFISVLEAALGKKAEKRFLPMQPGDVYATAADISAIRTDYGFEPTTSIESGLQRFADWFIAYRKGLASQWSGGWLAQR